MYLTEKEIMSQHEALVITLEHILKQSELLKSFAEGKKKLVFMGCGSSFMVAKSCQNIFMTQKPACTFAVSGGDYILDPEYYRHVIDDSIVVIFSRSGLTTEILMAANIIKKQQNAKMLSVTMKKNNDLSKISDYDIALPWALDESVCQTRSVTNFYAAALLLCGIFYENRELLSDVKAVIGSNEEFKSCYRGVLEEIGRKNFDDVVILADGGLCGIAEEGVLAFNEISFVKGNYYNILDYRHGPKTLNDSKTLTIIVPRPSKNRYQEDVIEDIKACGGHVITVGEKDYTEIGADYSVVIEGAKLYESWGIPFIFVAQMIALTKALKKNLNPDKPKGLDAYIEIKY